MEKTKLHFFLLLGIFLLAFILRFYKLGVIPAGLAQDETSIGYNAYSILETGKDEYGVLYPVNFKAFGEYKLPGYIYLTVPSILYFGNTPLAVRLPSAIFGFLTVVVFYFFMKRLTNREDLSVIGTFLLAINPWHIHFSRAAFEVTPALFFIVIGSYLFLESIKNKKHLLLGLSAIFFVLSIYTYNICRVFSPLLFVIMLYHFRNEINLRKTNWILSLIPAVFITFPFLFSIFNKGGVSSTAGTLIYSSAPVQARLLEDRSIVFMQNPILAKLLFNKFILTGLEYIKNIISYFSVSFLFLTGSDHGNHGIGNVGMFYIFDFILIVSGVVSYIKKNEKWITLMFLWILAEILVAAFTRESPHGTRGFFLIPPLIVIGAFGAKSIYVYIEKILYRLRYVVVLFGVLFVLFNIAYYLSSYYYRFPALYAKEWRTADKDVVSYIKDNQNKYDEIFIDNSSGFIYTSLLYELPYSPKLFQQESVRIPDDSEGFSKVTSIGKFKFGELKSQTNTGKKKILVITSADNIGQQLNIIATIYYPQRPVVVAEGQNILQYPTKDIAYVLAETK